MAGKTSRGNNHRKGKYSDYRSYGVRAKNKRRKLEKHLRKFPQDKDAVTALNNI